MRHMILLACLLLAACECDEAPDTWRGARLTGCSDGGSASCCSYSGSRCHYVVCSNECGSWEQSSWSCWP